MTIDHDALRAAAADIAYPDLHAQGVWDMRGTNPPAAPLKRPRRRPTSWVDHAACRHADPDIFFPETSSSTMYREALAALAAAQAGRDAVLIDIDRRNVDLTRTRITDAMQIVHEEIDGDTWTWTVDPGLPGLKGQHPDQLSLLGDIG